MAIRLLDDADTKTVTDADLISGGDKDTTYTYREITREAWKAIKAKHTKRVPNRTTHRMEEDVDTAAFGEAILDFVLVGWTGVMFRGEPAPCTLEMKLRIGGDRVEALAELAGANQIHAAAEGRAATFPRTA